MKVLNFQSTCNVIRYHLASSHGHMLAEDESDRPLEKIDEECTNQSEEQPTDSLTGLEEALEELRRYEDGSEETHQFSGYFVIKKYNRVHFFLIRMYKNIHNVYYKNKELFKKLKSVKFKKPSGSQMRVKWDHKWIHPNIARSRLFPFIPIRHQMLEAQPLQPIRFRKLKVFLKVPLQEYLTLSRT